MAKFQMGVNISELAAITARLGSGTAQSWDGKETGKAVKFAGDSRFDQCAAGDPIEGFVFAVEDATLDNYSIGSVQTKGRKLVLADGLQATPGTGTIAVGDYVVAGSATTKGTALTDYKPKVCKATVQPGTTEAGAVTDVNEHIKVTLFAWRVVAILGGGTGAVGDTLVIERI